MESSTIFPSFVSIVFSIWAAITLYQYAAIGTRKRVLSVSYLGFMVSFGCVVLISFDIDNTLANRYREFLYYAWRVMYWALQVLSWVIYPFNMEKERTGSWRKSLHRNAIWWGIYAVGGLVAVIYFFGMTTYGFQGMLAFAYAASNTFGLLLIIVFAGYGLVAAPQGLYLKSKPNEYLDYLHIKTVAGEDSRLAAKYDLQDVYAEARKTVDPNDPDMVAVSTFLATSYGVQNASASAATGALRQATVPVESDQKVALRDALQTAKRSICSWKMLVRECILYENIYMSQAAGHGAIPEFQAKLHRGYCWFLRGLAVLSGLLSVLIIIGQSTIFIDVWWLSVLAIVFRRGVWENPSVMEGPVSSFLIQALLTIPLLWVYYCCFWSLTRLKLAKFYGLYPMHNTDTISLMWCGGMLIRIAFPLVYNYLFVLRVPSHPATVFEEMQGFMNVVPLLGKSITEYFPLLILVVACLTLSNTYSKIMTCLGLTSLQFETASDPAGRQKLIDEGRKLIVRERQTRRGSVQLPSVLEMGIAKKLGSDRKDYAILSDEEEPSRSELNTIS